jgi:glucosamine--fructose-6-phosphate aminotransferase (isomerizing)
MGDSPFLAEIFSLPDLIQESNTWLASSSARLAELIAGQDISQIVLTGCGDSHHAAIASRLAFQQLAGLPCQAMTAMELARYQAAQLRLEKTGRTLVVGISSSGQVSRTVEALEMAKLAGATVLAVTGNLQSDLSGVADAVYQVTEARPLPHGKGVIIPGTRTFFLSLLALYHLAIQIGMARGTRPTSKLVNLNAELGGMADLVEQTITQCNSSIVKLTDDWSDADRFVFCGSGPNYGTALFSAAKMIEAAGDPALGQDLEEWAHLQYFERQVDTPTVIISAMEHDGDRAHELTMAAKAIGRRVVLITSGFGVTIEEPQESQHLIAVGKVSDCFSPVLTSLPGMLLAAYRSEAISEPFFRGFGGGRSRKGGGGISRIRSSNRLRAILD